VKEKRLKGRNERRKRCLDICKVYTQVDDAASHRVSFVTIVMSSVGEMASM